MRRVLAVDLGRARIGLARSDLLGVTAQPLAPLRCAGAKRDLQQLVRIVEEGEVGTIVVGLPLKLSGEAGEAAERAERFAEGLRRRLPAVEVVLWDERLTTVEAERTMISGGVRRRRRREVIDGLAAVLILQSYLDARPRTGEEPLD